MKTEAPSGAGVFVQLETLQILGYFVEVRQSFCLCLCGSMTPFQINSLNHHGMVASSLKHISKEVVTSLSYWNINQSTTSRPTWPRLTRASLPSLADLFCGLPKLAAKPAFVQAWSLTLHYLPVQAAGAPALAAAICSFLQSCSEQWEFPPAVETMILHRREYWVSSSFNRNQDFILLPTLTK